MVSSYKWSIPWFVSEDVLALKSPSIVSFSYGCFSWAQISFEDSEDSADSGKKYGTRGVTEINENNINHVSKK